MFRTAGLRDSWSELFPGLFIYDFGWICFFSWNNGELIRWPTWLVGILDKLLIIKAERKFQKKTEQNKTVVGFGAQFSLMCPQLILNEWFGAYRENARNLFNTNFRIDILIIRRSFSIWFAWQSIVNIRRRWECSKMVRDVEIYWWRNALWANLKSHNIKFIGYSMVNGFQ